jgi:hypothetical protein
MILSRLTKAVREQNWFAVVLEFVIVVSGVLLAFQVSAWSGQAAERAYARDILIRLHSELIAVGGARTSNLQPRADRLEILLEARPIVMGVAGADTLSARHCFAIATSHVGLGVAPDAFPSLDELMASGALQSVESGSLRHVAMQLFSKRSAVRTSSERNAARVINLPMVYPGAVQATLYPDPDDGEDGWGRSATCDLSAMRADSSFQAALIENTAMLWSQVDFTYGFLDEAIADLREALETELDIAQTPDAPDPAP